MNAKTSSTAGNEIDAAESFNEILNRMPPGYSADTSFSFMPECPDICTGKDFNTLYEYLDYKTMMASRANNGVMPYKFSFVLSEKEITRLLGEAHLNGSFRKTLPDQDGHYSLLTPNGVVRVYSVNTDEGRALLKKQGAVG